MTITSTFMMYHLQLHCYVVVELKAVEFVPNLSQADFYISAVDEYVKAPEDKTAIGLLLCRSKATPKHVSPYVVSHNRWALHNMRLKQLFEECSIRICHKSKTIENQLERQRMRLADVIDVFIAEIGVMKVPSEETPNAVYCVRGAGHCPISIGEFGEYSLRYV